MADFANKIKSLLPFHKKYVEAEKKLQEKEARLTQENEALKREIKTY